MSPPVTVISLIMVNSSMDRLILILYMLLLYCELVFQLHLILLYHFQALSRLILILLLSVVKIKSTKLSIPMTAPSKRKP